MSPAADSASTTQARPANFEANDVESKAPAAFEEQERVGAKARRATNMLLLAAMDGDAQACASLIAAGGIDFTARTEEGLDAAMWAAHCGSLACVELLAPRCDLAACDPRGMTAADLAVESGSAAVAGWIRRFSLAREERAQIESAAGHRSLSPRKAISL